MELHKSIYLGKEGKGKEQDFHLEMQVGVDSREPSKLVGEEAQSQVFYGMRYNGNYLVFF